MSTEQGSLAWMATEEGPVSVLLVVNVDDFAVVQRQQGSWPEVVERDRLRSSSQEAALISLRLIGERQQRLARLATECMRMLAPQDTPGQTISREKE